MKTDMQNGTILRITCPGAGFPKEDRIRGLLESCFDWAYSEPMRRLVGSFGASIGSCRGKSGRADYIRELHDFMPRWDYRNGRERWAVEDDGIVTDDPGFVMEQVKLLGLVDAVPPTGDVDHIIPLGGARSSNHIRCLMAKKVIDEYGCMPKTLVALSGTRPINEIERPYIDEYAKGAQTEYEAICAALEKVFGLDTYTEKTDINENINLCSAVRKYDGKYGSSEIFSLAAPSSDPGRRADSYDTFEYMLKHFKIGAGSRLLLVTSTIYVPFQYLKFMKMAIAGGFEVDCIGTDISGAAPPVGPASYLQEVKAAVDAIFELYRYYQTDIM